VLIDFRLPCFLFQEPEREYVQFGIGSFPQVR
jgi:hypothetical protein